MIVLFFVLLAIVLAISTHTRIDEDFIKGYEKAKKDYINGIIVNGEIEVNKEFNEGYDLFFQEINNN